jgi:hypothetical protein
MANAKDPHEGVWDWLQYETDLAERDQREVVRSGELEFLDQTKTHADFCQAMKAKNELLAESPDTPLDEVTYRDYCIRRAMGERR